MHHPLIFKASWILLLLLAVAIASISSFSASRALSRGPDTVVAGYSIDELATSKPEAADALRGRRLTASAWALAFGLLLIQVVVGPYRRGERWAWWAILVSVGVAQVVSLMRIPAMGTRLGADGSIVLLIVLAVALAAGAPRMFLKENG